MGRSLLPSVSAHQAQHFAVSHPSRLPPCQLPPGGRQGRGYTGGGSEMVLAFCIKWMYDWTGLMDLIYFFNFSQVRRKRHANIYLRPGGRALV